jgi:hypothetical protein
VLIDRPWWVAAGDSVILQSTGSFSVRSWRPCLGTETWFAQHSPQYSLKKNGSFHSLANASPRAVVMGQYLIRNGRCWLSVSHNIDRISSKLSHSNPVTWTSYFRGICSPEGDRWPALCSVGDCNTFPGYSGIISRIQPETGENRSILLKCRKLMIRPHVAEVVVVPTLRIPMSADSYRLDGQGSIPVKGKHMASRSGDHPDFTQWTPVDEARGDWS